MKRMTGAIAAATATFASAIGLVTTGAWLISEAALRPPLLVLEVAIVSVRAFGIARGSFRWVERVVSHDAALHETVERRARLWSALAKAGPRGAWALRRGDVITRLMQDAEVMQDRLTRVVVPATAALVTGAGAVALQWHLQPAAGVCFLSAFAVAGVLVPILAHRLEFAAAQRTLLERAELNSVLSELVEHREEMRALGAAPASIALLAASDRRRVSVETRTALLAAGTQFIALAASGLAIVGALVVAVPAVAAGTLQGPHLAVVALLPWSASEVVAALAAAASAQVRVRSAAARLEEVEGLQPRIPHLEATTAPGLQVRDLAVRWADLEVVHDVTFSIRPGERVALVGPSGSGKSSIVSAVLGLVEYRGSVGVGDAAPDASRASLITAVPQVPHVFRTTVRENLRLAAGPVPDEHLEEVLDRVGLGGLELERDLAAHPLSGGEALRLGLARALLVDAPIVVLDEPTEHLDAETAQQVLVTIHEATRDRAVLLTTHRVADLRDFDRVHVLGSGTIMESGTFEECRTGSGWFRDAVDWHLDKKQVD